MRIEQELAVGDVAQSALRVFLQARLKQRARFRWHAIPVGFEVEHGGDRVGNGLTCEQWNTGQHLV